MKKYRLVAMLLIATATSYVALAAGPSDVAKADFSLWPHPVNNRIDFDFASRLELIVSTNMLNDLLQKDNTAADFGIKEIQRDSLQKWSDRVRKLWMIAYANASKSCVDKSMGCGYVGATWAEFTRFTATAESEIAGKDKYQQWLASTRRFNEVYLKEQMRLAALFPQPTSEIATLDNSEITGDEYPDGEFSLSLDDGPTVTGGDTDRYADMLRQQRIPSFFFVLGNALEKRMQATSTQDLQRLYQGHCLDSHGYEHKSHQKWDDWKVSLEKTGKLISRVYPEKKRILFRPPYGQRHAELLSYINQNQSKVILWNIDSQDWHGKISAEDVAARVKKLMLLKRRGMILFHDTHKKGLTAIPDIAAFAKQTGLTWAECDKLN